MTHTWHWVRHGESIANAQGWVAGHRDVALSPRGERQAQDLASTVAELSLGRTLCSDLQRASHTATLLTRGLDCHPTPSPQLRERHLGSWEGAPVSALRADGRMQVLLSWQGQPPGGESQAQVAARVLSFLQTVEDHPGPTLVVAHGGVLRTILGLLSQTPLDKIGRTKVHNCSLRSTTCAPGTWTTLRERVQGPT